MPAPVRHPHGWVRHYARLLTPAGATAGRVLAHDARARAESMRAAAARRRGATQRGLVVAPGLRLAWRSVAAPAEPGPLGAVVHPVAVATCDMDRATMLGATPFLLPLHLGHECVAEVLRVGSDVTTVRPGQRVVVPFQISCGTCEPCRAGRTGSCAGVLPLAMYGFGIGGGNFGGAVADELAVPFADAMLVPLPDGVDPVAAASVADNVSDAYRHIGPNLRPGDDVVIVAGLEPRAMFTASNPLYTGLIARALGAGRVTLVDARPVVRRHAERLGLDAVDPCDLDRAATAPLVVDVSVCPAGLRLALALTAPDGLCSSAGLLHNSMRFPALSSYIRNVTLRIGRAHARSAIPLVLELMVDGRLHPEAVTTLVAPIDDAIGAYREHCGPEGVKTILVA